MLVDSTGNTRILSYPTPRKTTCQTSLIRGKLNVKHRVDLPVRQCLGRESSRETIGSPNNR